MNLVERLLREAGQNKADLQHMREREAALLARLEEAEARIAKMEAIVEQARGGWHYVTSIAGIVAAVVGATVAVINWFKSGRG